MQELKPGIASNSFLKITLTTKDANASLRDFFVSAKSLCGQGSLQGKPQGEGKYKLGLDDSCIAILALDKPIDLESFRKGEPAKLIMRYQPEDRATAREEGKILVIGYSSAKRCTKGSAAQRGAEN